MQTRKGLIEDAIERKGQQLVYQRGIEKWRAATIRLDWVSERERKEESGWELRQQSEAEVALSIWGRIMRQLGYLCVS